MEHTGDSSLGLEFACFYFARNNYKTNKFYNRNDSNIVG